MIGYGFLAIVIIALDIFSKQWALSRCMYEVVMNPLLSCQVTINRGVAWSMLHSDSPLVFGMVTCVIAGIICLLAWYTYQQWSNYYTIWGETLVLAGASANFIDRLWHAGVIDFIMVGYKQFTWPVFNVADISIVCGVIVMLVLSYRR